MRSLSESLERRVLLGDGAPARQLRVQKLDLKRDFFGAEGCIDVLNLTRAGLVREAHIAYLDAGADVVRTNTLDASPLSLQRFGLGDEAFCINYSAAQIASEAVDSVPGRGRRRFVLGVVRDQGWDLAPRILERAVATQAEGLLAGGVDGIALDLTPGRGRSRPFLRGAKRARARLGTATPIFLQRVAQGPEFSASLCTLADGVIHFHPGQRARRGWLDAALGAQAVNLIGGGATPAETAKLDKVLRARAEDGLRPLIRGPEGARRDRIEPASSTLYPELEPARSGKA